MGGITSEPMRVSASVMAVPSAVGSAPVATFSFAAMSWWARASNPFPWAGLFRMLNNCSAVYEVVPSWRVVNGQASGWFFQ